MLDRLKISHHKHTGKLIHHEHTSYSVLAVLILFVGVVLSFSTVSLSTAQAYVTQSDNTPYAGPSAGSIGLTGAVPSKPPTTGAVITSPTNGQHFTTTPITVSGTCPDGLLIEIFKNDIFGGSTFCDGGKFSLQIDLLYGQNVLTAQVYDALNQSGPVSAPVTVFYDSTLGQGSGLANLDFGSAQLLLNSDAVYRGVFPNEPMTFNLTILGGQAPYAVNIDWGDSTNSLVPRGSSGTFSTPHTYKKGGVYYISVKATDNEGRVAFLTVVAIVNGQPDPAAATTGSKPASPSILFELWPLYLTLIVLVSSFYMGERHEKKVLEKHGQLIQQV
jgi:hypothetical protein